MHSQLVKSTEPSILATLTLFMSLRGQAPYPTSLLFPTTGDWTQAYEVSALTLVKSRFFKEWNIFLDISQE